MMCNPYLKRFARTARRVATFWREGENQRERERERETDI